MAMFDKHRSAKQTPPEVPESRPAPAAPPVGGVDKAAMIGRGIRIAGDVNASTHLKIEGEVEGRGVKSSQDVEVAESGRVVASIEAKIVRVAGEVSGDIVGTEKVVVLKSGRVQGNIVAPRVQLEDGALFRGSIDMTPEPAAAKPAPAKAAPEAARSAPTAAAQGAGSETTETRKEPGLTLKSG